MPKNAQTPNWKIVDSGTRRSRVGYLAFKEERKKVLQLTTIIHTWKYQVRTCTTELHCIHPDIVQLTLNHLFHNILTTTSKFLSNEIVGLLRDCCWIPKLPLIYVKIGTYWQNMYNVLSVVVHLNQTNNTPLTTNPKNHSNHTKSTFLYHSFVSIVKHLNLRPPIQKIAHGLLT